MPYYSAVSPAAQSADLRAFWCVQWGYGARGDMADGVVSASKRASAGVDGWIFVYVSTVPTFMLICYLILFLCFKSKGEYRPVGIDQEE